MTPAQKAFQFPEVRVVEASAGSGKTFALAKRYVQLLLNPNLHFEQVPIRNILAITFTNKAAFEMKARILDFLKRIALKSLSSHEAQDILGPIDVDEDTASHKAYAIMEELIHNYNFFQVQTIDSFINALLSGCAFKIGLSANFKIKRNYAEYLEYSLDQMIDAAGQNKDIQKTFERFLHQYLYLENKTGWFPKKDILSLLEALYQQSNTYGFDFVPYDLGEDLIVKKRQILSLMQKLQKEAPEGVDGRFLKSLENFLNKYSHGFDIDRISDYFAREELPVRKGVKIPAALDRLWDKIRKQLTELSEGEAYSLFNPYIEVFNQVSADFETIAAKDDLLFLPELNRKASLLFDEGMVSVEELYYRLATRFHHYLIDEFQDTSVLQWHNLFLMVEEALSTGGSLFYVGDKKQAIYGFRGGEVKLFDRIQKQFQHFNVQTEQLDKNYRSQKAVVEFNNKVFSMDNLRRFIAVKEGYESEKNKKGAVFFSAEDYREVENVFHNSQQKVNPAKKGGYVKVEYADDDKKEERNEDIRLKLVRLIGTLKKRFSYRQVAVLTRDNKEVEEVTSWLLAEGIFVESERTLNIKENKIIQDLMAFLQFLNSPIDDFAFATFLLGDVFPKAVGVKPEKLHQFIFGLRQRVKEEKNFYLYREFRHQFPQIWEKFIDEFFKNVGLYPLYEFMTSIVGRLEILTHFPDQQGFVMRFLEVIKKQEEEYSDIASFLDNFESLGNEDLYVNVSDSDSIKVLTIHKAKGLEFPVVIIPFLGMGIHVGSGGNLGQQSYLLDIQDNHFKLLRIKNKYLNFSEPLAEIRHREYIKSFFSELNNIYVALTRAEQELYAFVPKRVGNSFNFVNFLIPEDGLEIGQPHDGKVLKKEKVLKRLKLPKAQYHDWIGFLKDEFLDTTEIFSRQQVLNGKIMHSMLAVVGNLKERDKGDVLKRVVRHVRQEYAYIGNLKEYEKRLEQIVEAEELSQFFYVEQGTVYQEVELVNSAGHTKRLDRLIVTKDEIWVIDYKSSKKEENIYREQVRGYMDILQETSQC